MATRQASSEPTVSLFPFLAVLVCAMGALILLLLAMTQKIRLQQMARELAMVQAPAPAPVKVPQRFVQPSPPPRVDEEYEAERARRRAAWRQALADAREMRDRERQATGERRRSLAAAEQRADETRAGLRQVRSRLQAIGAEKQSLAASAKDLHEERHQIVEQLALTQRDMTSLKQRLASESTKFELVPYDGASGTARRPIFIECTGKGFRILPEGEFLSAENLSGFNESFNPLLNGIRALVNYWNGKRLASEESNPEPYLLFLVRPSGTLPFYVARQFLERLHTPFGYELIEEDWPLHTPPPDAMAQAVLHQAISETIALRDKLARSLADARTPAARQRKQPSGGRGTAPLRLVPEGDGNGSVHGRGHVGGDEHGGGGENGGDLAHGRGTGPESADGIEWLKDDGAGHPHGSGVIADARPGSGAHARPNNTHGAGAGKGAGPHVGNPPGQFVPAPAAIGLGNSNSNVGDEHVEGGQAGTGQTGPGIAGPGKYDANQVGAGQLNSGHGTAGQREPAQARSPNASIDQGGPIHLDDFAQDPSGHEGTSQQPRPRSAERDAPGIERGTAAGVHRTPEGEVPALHGLPDQEEEWRGAQPPGPEYRSGRKGTPGSSTARNAQSKQGGAGSQAPPVGDEVGSGLQLEQHGERHGAGQRDQRTAKRWGYAHGRATVGLEKTLEIHVYAKQILIGPDDAALRVGEGETRDQVVQRVLEEIERSTEGWGKPPNNFYWIPSLRFVIHPGGNQHYERLNGPLRESGLFSTVDFVLGAAPRTSSAKAAK